MSFSSPIYADHNGIFLIFIRVTFQYLWVPVRNRSEICHFEKSDANATLDGQGIYDPGYLETTPRSFLAWKQLVLTRKIKHS